MSRSTKTWVLALVCTAAIGSTAAVLARFQSQHRLGKPGLRLVDVPLLNEKGSPATSNSIALPERILDFDSKLWPVTEEELKALPRDTTYGRRIYTAKDGYQVQVSGVLMGTDRTSIHKPEFCLPSQGFQLGHRSQRFITIDRPHRYALPITRIDGVRDIRQADGRTVRQGAVYVYWFVSENRLSNDHFQRMWWLALDLVRTGELQRWAYLSVLGPCAPGDEDRTYARLEAMIQAMVPEFQLTTGPEASSAGGPMGFLPRGDGNLPPMAEAGGSLREVGNEDARLSGRDSPFATRHSAMAIRHSPFPVRLASARGANRDVEVR